MYICLCVQIVGFFYQICSKLIIFFRLQSLWAAEGDGDQRP